VSVAIGAGKLPRATRADPTASTTKVRGPGEVVFLRPGTPIAELPKDSPRSLMEPPVPVLHKRLVTQSFHSPLNRVAESSVYLTVLAMLRWPRYACSVLVSTPRLANA
jgi:hypothetical protein